MASPLERYELVRLSTAPTTMTTLALLVYAVAGVGGGVGVVDAARAATGRTIDDSAIRAARAAAGPPRVRMDGTPVSGWIDGDACPLSLASRGRDLNAAMVPVPG